MNKTIENIASFWRLEAKLEDNNKYFYFYDEVQDILDNKKCFVIGRKGTGKTAICEYIAKIHSYDTFAIRLSFKNFPFNELYHLQNQKYTRPNEYITLWKYVIYSNICKLMAGNEAVDGTVRTELGKLYPQRRNLARNISDWTSVQFGANVLGNGGTIKVDRQITENTASWIERTNILEDIILQYGTNSKYYIIFDELDEDYRDFSDDTEKQSYISLLTSLFKAVQDVKSIFLDEDVNIMPVVFLRDDIYMIIKDSDKNKWSDLKIELEWTKEKIKKLLAYRISKDMGKQNPVSFDKAWSCIFENSKVSYGDKQNKKIDAFSFIERSTYLRPRDFIQYIQACCANAKEKGKNKISPNIIKFEDRAFSNYLKSEIEDEVFPLLPEIKTIFQILSNLRKWNLKTSEFVEEYKKYLTAGTIKEQNIDYVLDTLYNFSVIGNQHKSIKNVQYFKYMQTNMTYNKEENIVIHRGLFKALRII